MTLPQSSPLSSLRDVVAKPVIVLGSCIIDITAVVPHFPLGGESLVSPAVITQVGGKASNQAVAISRLGSRVELITRVGHDNWADMAMQLWRQELVGTQFVVRDQADNTGLGLVIVSGGQNITISHLGANAHLAAEDLKDLEPNLPQSGVMLAHLNAPLNTLRYAFERAKAARMTTILNLSPMQELPMDMLSLVSIAVVNEVEMEEMTGLKPTRLDVAVAGATKILQYVNEAVVATLGARGSVVKLKDRTFCVPPFTVEAKDSTGAGDAFCAALAALMNRNISVVDSIRFASAAAALSVTKLGTWSSMPFLHQVIAFLEEHDSEGLPIAL